ncbi:MAG: tetratricopeptide repeat protein [Anaerolineae bacterium]|nr:tetratricopeptide repeat protein [Anaerolineae bacterium]
MPHTIRIRETSASTTDGAFNATLSFDHGSEYPIHVSDPFAGSDKEANLEWYFEEWLTFPFTNTVKAGQAAASVREYGDALFRQVFKTNADAYAEYRAVLNSGDLRDSHIEIAGSPEFHALHWEALHDPQQPEPLVMSCTLVRKNLKPLPSKAVMREAESIRVLVITARPFGDRDVGYRTISRPLINALRDAKLNVEIDLLRPATYRALREQLEQKGIGHYHVLHFDTHGALLTYEQFKQSRDPNSLLFLRWGRGDIQRYDGVRGYVFFEQETNQGGDIGNIADGVQADELAKLLQQFQVPMVVLNACQSGKQVGAGESSLGARLMQAGMQNVLAMGYSVTVSAATQCMTELYKQLFAGNDLQHSLRRARVALRGDKFRRAYFDQRIELEDWLLPVMYENSPAQLKLRPPSAAELSAQLARETGAAQFAAPTYGFFGRDLDILRIERMLMDNEGKMQPLLIYGMGGMGKSTLLRHLAGWWVQTGWAQRVFYFGWDAKAWTRQQIMHEMARALLNETQYRSQFLPLDEEQQQAMLGKLLRGHEHVLILDNLESVQAAQGDAPTASAALKHSLSMAEQQKLHSWVTALRGGKTRVLLGSRGREDWLCKHVYALGGLDNEAASELAEAVLRRSAATISNADRPHLQRLLKLLAGVPLALEVVLPNLKEQSPQAVLEALTQDDVKLDSTGDDADDKTKSILRCIEYSHEQLPPELQDLLACLAPFASVVFIGLLPQYSQELKKQPALADVPFEQWEIALQVAERWGLISVHPQAKGYVQLQPMLPYFLRGLLANTPERRVAIEKAFYHQYTYEGEVLRELMQSQQPQKRQIGWSSIELEYENLLTALAIGLANHASLRKVYIPLQLYLQERRDYVQGLALAERLQISIIASQSNSLQAHKQYDLNLVLDSIAQYYVAFKRYTDADLTCQKILALAKLHEHHEIISSTCHLLGIIAQEQKQWEKADLYYKDALKTYIKLNHLDAQARTYHQLGVVMKEQRKWTESKEHYQKALQIFIETKNHHSKGILYHSLGGLALDQADLNQAKGYYLLAMQVFINLNDHYGQAVTHNQLGMVAQKQLLWNKAEWHYQEGLRIKIGLKDSSVQAISYDHLGRCAMEQGLWAQAEKYFQTALQLKIEFNDRYAQAGTYRQLAILVAEQHQWAQAKAHLLQALQIFREFDDQHSVGDILGNLALLWRASGDTDLSAAVAQVLGSSADKVQALFEQVLSS